MAGTGVKKPTGLSIARNGNKYTLSWKAGEEYPNGQYLKYRTKNTSGVWSAWSKEETIKSKTTSKVLTLTATAIQAVEFSVRGISNFILWTKNKKKLTYVCSDAASYTWTAQAPSVPTLTYANDGTNKGTFTWANVVSNAEKQVLTRIEAQTCYVRSTAAPAQWGAVLAKGASGSQAITEATTVMAAGNIVRWYRVRAVGPGGTSAWKTASHAYGAPASPFVKTTRAADTQGRTRIQATWINSYDSLHPIDKLTVQYAIGVPTTVSLTAPSSGWSDAVELALSGLNNTVIVDVEDAVSTDECMWVRIKAEHDGLNSYSNAEVAQCALLATPTLDAVPNTTTGMVSITITEETSCTVACTAIFYRAANNPSNDRVVAILPRGTTATTLNIPAIKGAATTCFGAYAFVGSYVGTAITSKRMTSLIVLDSDIGAVAPRTVVVAAGPRDGTVRIGWEWTWTLATQAELSWADSEDAWESTAQPTTFVVEDRFATSWIIAGLELGKRWYFRVRLKQVDEENDVTGPWSTIQYFDLTSTPDRPALSLSKSVINQGEPVTFRWAFSSSDGTRQAYAEICVVSYNNAGAVSYGTVIARTTVGQSIEIRRLWTTGMTYYFAVRTTSTSGIHSPWSEPVSLYVAEPVSISVTNSNITYGYLETITTYTKVLDPDTGEYTWEETDTRILTYEEEYDSTSYTRIRNGYTEVISETDTTKIESTYALDTDVPTQISAMPITVTVKGAGTSGTTTVSIVRAENYHIIRPDGNEFDGYEGENIFTKSQTGEKQISIETDELVGYLDDGAVYNLIATVTDEYGQTASEIVRFIVDWGHKAGEPGANITADKHQRIVMITPIAPANAFNGDVCDVYRLTIDKPELIYRGAVFGETYVDPYPGFGEFCGHRLVTRTANGDYASNGAIAWLDTGVDDGDVIREDSLVIDVDGQQIELPYNLSLSNSWKKDFKRTTYLGGSIQGDWNQGVTRDMSANTVLVRGDDLDKQIAMRDLAGFAGVAHVRTPDGSSITANVQINESQDYATKEISYTMTIQAIDPEEQTGMTLDEWNELYPAGR